MGYLANFMVYTFAMVGVIVIALLIFKQTTQGGCVQKSKYLKVIDSMSLGPRKTLYIVSAGREKFLIAGDIDKTNLISKLENSNEPQTLELSEKAMPAFNQTMQTFAKQSYSSNSKVGIQSSLLNTKKANDTSVMRNLVNLMK